MTKPMLTRRPIPLFLGLLGTLMAALLAEAAMGRASNGALKEVEKIQFSPLKIDSSLSQELNARSPRFEFHTGASHFLAYSIPDSDKPLLIDVVSYFDSDAAGLKSAVFYPLVAILDQDLLVRRSTSLNDLTFDLPFLQRTTHPAYRVSLRVEPHSEEKYIVIYTSGSLLNDHNPSNNASKTFSSADGEKVFGYGASDLGRVNIAVESLSQ